MKSIWAVLILFVSALCVNAQQAYLQYGTYKWPLEQKKYQIVKETQQVAGGESRLDTIIEEVSEFAGSSWRIVKLNKPVIDSVWQINPVTLEEKAVVDTTDWIGYNLDGGDILAAEMQKMLRGRFKVSGKKTKGLSLSIEIVRGDIYKSSKQYYDVAKQLPVPEIKKGDKVILGFEWVDKDRTLEDKVGKVLFEII